MHKVKLEVGDKITCILQARVDAKRKVWLCARDKFNSGNPVYVGGVPETAKSGDLITAVVADDRGTLYYQLPTNQSDA